MNDQPEALRVATKLDEDFSLDHVTTTVPYAARLLREQHAEIERLKAENERLHKENERVQNTKHYEAPFGFVLNPDYLVPELEAENERLRADAERYRWLRVGGIDHLLHGRFKALDVAIDAAMGEK